MVPWQSRFLQYYRKELSFTLTQREELLEIRHQASRSQILPAPPTHFAFLSIHPIGTCITNMFPLAIVKINPFSNMELYNIREWMEIFWNTIVNATPPTPLSR